MLYVSESRVLFSIYNVRVQGFVKSFVFYFADGFFNNILASVWVLSLLWSLQRNFLQNFLEN